MELKYTAVIVEPRKHKAIEFVLNNICECLSMNWNIVFFHGCNNEEYVKNIIDKVGKNGQILQASDSKVMSGI
jgi:hypothetical protein